jgi:hypothetical protein
MAMDEIDKTSRQGGRMKGIQKEREKLWMNSVSQKKISGGVN